MSLLRSIWRSTNFKALILFVLNYDCVYFTCSPKDERVARHKREYENKVFIRGWRVLNIRLQPPSTSSSYSACSKDSSKEVKFKVFNFSRPTGGT